MELLTFNIDGIKVLGAFTSEAALYKWAKKPTEYTAIGSQNVFQLCEQNNIGRVVINSDQDDMFVLERNMEHITTGEVEKSTQVMIGYPIKPLSKEIIQKLIEEFKVVGTIAEAYQYLMEMEGEQSIVIGIKFSAIMENSRKLANYAMSNVLAGETLYTPVDMLILNESGIYDSVRNIPGSLIYKR